jgi:protein TonB
MNSSQSPVPIANKSRLMVGGVSALILLGGAISLLRSGREIQPPLAKSPESPNPKVFPIPQPALEPKIEPPKQPDPPLKKQMVVQEPIDISEPVPEKPQPPPPTSQPVSTTIEGPGELSLGPGGDGGPGGPGDPTIGGPGKGGKWDYYAAKVQETIKATLANNPSTKSSSFSMEVRVWADADGRIIQAKLIGTSGSPVVDAAIESQALTGRMLHGPPPTGMPMPICMRISARKPI